MVVVSTTSGGSLCFGVVRIGDGLVCGCRGKRQSLSQLFLALWRREGRLLLASAGTIPSRAGKSADRRRYCARAPTLFSTTTANTFPSLRQVNLHHRHRPASFVPISTSCPFGSCHLLRLPCRVSLCYCAAGPSTRLQFSPLAGHFPNGNSRLLPVQQTPSSC